MLRWALIFFIVSIVAALFGFTGISVAAAGIARIFFFVFVAVFFDLSPPQPLCPGLNSE